MKTPEEMAAEYATNQDVQHMLDAPRSNSVLYHSFLAGYKAAQELFAQANDKSLSEVLEEAIKDVREAKDEQDT